MLLAGAVAAQAPQKKEQKIKLGTEKKITKNLARKIAGAAVAEELPVIIFFKKKEKTAVAKLQAQSAVISAIGSKGGGVKYRYNLVDAVSASLPAGKIAELAASADIERIYYDEIVSLPPEPPEQNVSIQLDVSTQAIGANYAWNTLGYTGTGITVAVVDSGIDYTHPDFGSCGSVGSGCRVAGGYDFVNSDTDPADDNGHGTHVAGTVAANGTIKGVAPNATLLGVKVLDSGGSGYTSDIISGIDWSVANGADIISMSIGGSSQPNDEFASPIDVVADAAVDKGVVVVIAAGNEGPGTGTINYIGTGKKVITVGASDDTSTATITDDTIADFSNRGPTAFGRLDPEVVAPGVNICSSRWDNYQPGSQCIDNNHVSISGTSMATPHVSGAAALLLEKNSSLTPAEVRRILMHTSSNLTASNIHVFEKGAGIINVTKVLTYNISATISGDDRWEASVIPGFNASAMLALGNDNTYPVNFTFTIEAITDLEGDNSLPASSFSLPNNVTVPAQSTSNVKIGFRALTSASPAIYGTTLVVSNDTTGTLRIPIVITIPLVESGTIQGTVDDDYLYSGGVLYDYGDWIYYKVKSHNGTSLYASLNWTDSSDNLDLYLYAPNGVEVDFSNTTSSTSEQVNLSNMVYDEYWVAVHARSLSGTGSYNLTVTYPAGSQGNLQVSPPSWQGYVGNNETKNITFTITNDGVSKSNLNLSIKILQDGDNGSWSYSGLAAGFCTYRLFATDMSLNTNDTRYVTTNLTWGSSSTNDLDLYLKYWDDNGNNIFSFSEYYFTRFSSEHWNNYLGENWEKIENADIQHYLKNYDDVGVYVCNYGSSSESFTVYVNLTDVAPWSAASVNESTISLTASQTKQVNVSINGSALSPGTYDAFFTIGNSTEDFATVSIRVFATSLFDSRDTNPSSSGGTWYLGDTVQVNGSGWGSNQEINVSINDSGSNQVGYWLLTADANGNFTEESTYPLDGADPIGTYTIYVSTGGAAWTQYDTFTVSGVQTNESAGPGSTGGGATTGYGWQQVFSNGGSGTDWARLTGSADRMNYTYGYKNIQIYVREEDYWSQDCGWWYVGGGNKTGVRIVDAANDDGANGVGSSYGQTPVQGRNVYTYSWGTDDDPGRWTVYANDTLGNLAVFYLYVKGQLNVSSITTNVTPTANSPVYLFANLTDNAGNPIGGSYTDNVPNNAWPTTVEAYVSGAGENFVVSLTDGDNNGEWTGQFTPANLGDHMVTVRATDGNTYWVDGRGSGVISVTGTFPASIGLATLLRTFGSMADSIDFSSITAAIGGLLGLVAVKKRRAVQ